MTNKIGFRNTKYQNFSGNKQGVWFMNTLSYFEFYRFPKYRQYFILSLLCIALAFLSLRYLPVYLLPLSFYIIYIATLTLIILYRQVCRYRGYFFYPQRIVRFLKMHKKELTITEFDNLATLGCNASKTVINTIYRSQQ